MCTVQLFSASLSLLAGIVAGAPSSCLLSRREELEELDGLEEYSDPGLAERPRLVDEADTWSEICHYFTYIAGSQHYTILSLLC